jgi:Protein of unknown function (DUF4238)
MSDMIDEKYIRAMKNNVVYRQHIFPKRSLDRFCADSGAIQIRWVDGRDSITTGSNNSMFCTPKKRTWSQKAELLYGKRIEDSFQGVIENSIENDLYELSESDSRKITEFYALWLYRCESIEIDYEGQSGGLTPLVVNKFEKESYEKIAVDFVDGRGALSARSMRCYFILGGIMHFLDRHHGLKWFMSKSSRVEFILPDNPGGMFFIPISPHRCFLAGGSSPLLSADDCMHANATMISVAKKYYCARDFSRCV